MKFDKNGKAILKSIKYPTHHSDYWQDEIDKAFKEKRKK